VAGALVAFEGLDQSGKQTQAESLRDALIAAGRECVLLSFPRYETAIGTELHRALHGDRDYGPDVMQLLYVANRYETRARIAEALENERVILCDRYVASTIAYGEAQGLDAAWLADIQRFLPPADLTILLDIPPEVAVRRKSSGRDRYERDLDLLRRVRDSYRRQAGAPGWALVRGDRSKDEVSTEVRQIVASRLRLP
jgi:dTMP kinase